MEEIIGSLRPVMDGLGVSPISCTDLLVVAEISKEGAAGTLILTPLLVLAPSLTGC